ncbi:MAG: CotH kinase family protein [Owenweeksia sp.]
MKVKLLLNMIPVFLVLSCTKVKVSENLPDVSGFTVSSIPTNLPVINISLPEDSFDRLYTNYLDDIRLKAGFSYYHKATAQPVLQDVACIIDVRGRTSSRYSLKSLGVQFESAIDNDKIKLLTPAGVLPGDDLSSLMNLRLRNSGNDFGGTMLKDLVYTEFLIDAGLNLELRYGTPVQVFINDTYYGMLNLRSENDRLGLSHLLQVDTSSIVLMKIDGDNGNLEPEEGDEAPAIFFRKALLAEDAQTVKAMIDIDNFIDYIIFEDYVGNDDWPENNVSAYSINGSPFRFIVFDLDYAAFRTKNAILPEMEFRDDDVSRIYQLLRQDDDFVQNLESRQREIYQRFFPQRFNVLLQAAASRIEKEVLYNISKYGEPANTLQWRLNLENMQRDFERRDYYVREKYNID